MVLHFIFAEFLPRLFLSEESQRELIDFVILTPQWLMDAMKVIMELTMNDVTELSTSQLQNLVESGVADYEVLEACWKKMLSASELPFITVHHLCLIFQAYCLIYPIECTLCAAKSEVQKYIIPCKLPPRIVNADIFKRVKKYATFYFDFLKFLPEEIYHRLICLASTYSEAIIQEVYNCYSKESCFFSNLEGTRWIIQMELEKQRLKIMVT